MSGLLALFDDIAALTKLAAAQVDDIAAQATKVGAKVATAVIDDAAKAGAKSLGVVIDDTAVTPTYVQSLPAARELPIVWKIARGSLFNKLAILLPAALLIDYFAPWLMTPLLVIGGLYLCYEGAEKIVHLFSPHSDGHEQPQTLDAGHLEQERVAGAIKTDFILSAEIMTIALASIEATGTLTRALVLAVVALGITFLVYGAVALLVKMDDAGLVMAQRARLSATRAFGRGLVKAMPYLMSFISAVGTAAMLWVGGSIVLHGLPEFGLGALTHWVEHVAEIAGHAVPAASGAVEWLVNAGLGGIFGLALGLLVIPVAKYVINPVIDAVKKLFGRQANAAH
jgi:predicted DNA repair protein MutK